MSVLRSHFLSGVARHRAADGPAGGAAAPDPQGAPQDAAPLAGDPPAAAAADAAAADAAAAPAGDAPADASKPAADAPAKDAPAGDAPAPAAKPANEFAPSLLDEAGKAKPASEPKPADGAAKDGKVEAPKPDAAAKPTDAPGETPPAPITYEFTYPEGVKPEEVSTERMSAYTGILGEGKVAPEVGQKLLDLHYGELKQATDLAAQRQWDVFNETQKRWRDEVMADPELGGARHSTAITTVMSLVDQYGGDAAERKGLLDAFRVTGAANNPFILRLLHRAGVAIAREGEPRPAPPPRAPQLQGRERGLSRYRGNAA